MRNYDFKSFELYTYLFKRQLCATHLLPGKPGKVVRHVCSVLSTSRLASMFTQSQSFKRHTRPAAVR